MRIRKATSADVEAIGLILESTPELGAIAGRGPDQNFAIIRSNLERTLETFTSSVYVAESTEGMVTAYSSVHWTPFLFLEGGEAYITELFVDPNNRGQGVGSALLDEIEREAQNRGCSRLSLLNGKEVESYKRGFYGKRGWTERNTMVNFILEIDRKPN